eukprot:jgi/Mesvir1/20477/Mv12364-RA.2
MYCVWHHDMYCVWHHDMYCVYCQPLHVAVLRGNLDAARTLLEKGFPVSTKNVSGWVALDEAITMADAPMVRLLLEYEQASHKQLFKQKKPELLASLANMPDFRMQIKWEFGSPVFGKLLHRFAPHDEYTVWKKGTSLRVDGTLMGLNDTMSLRPWNHGHFSLLFNGKVTGSQLLLVDHGKQTAVDAFKFSGGKPRADLDAEVAQLIAGGATRHDVSARQLKLERAKGWFGRNVQEQVEGWDTTVYEGSALFISLVHRKVGFSFFLDGSFEDYLRKRPSPGGAGGQDGTSQGGPGVSRDGSTAAPASGTAHAAASSGHYSSNSVNTNMNQGRSPARDAHSNRTSATAYNKTPTAASSSGTNLSSAIPASRVRDVGGSSSAAVPSGGGRASGDVPAGPRVLMDSSDIRSPRLAQESLNSPRGSLHSDPWEEPYSDPLGQGGAGEPAGGSSASGGGGGNGGAGARGSQSGVPEPSITSPRGALGLRVEAVCPRVPDSINSPGGGGTESIHSPRASLVSHTHAYESRNSPRAFPYSANDSINSPRASASEGIHSPRCSTTSVPYESINSPRGGGSVRSPFAPATPLSPPSTHAHAPEKDATSSQPLPGNARSGGGGASLSAHSSGQDGAALKRDAKRSAHSQQDPRLSTRANGTSSGFHAHRSSSSLSGGTSPGSPGIHSPRAPGSPSGPMSPSSSRHRASRGSPQQSPHKGTSHGGFPVGGRGIRVAIPGVSGAAASSSQQHAGGRLGSSSPHSGSSSASPRACPGSPLGSPRHSSLSGGGNRLGARAAQASRRLTSPGRLAVEPLGVTGLAGDIDSCDGGEYYDDDDDHDDDGFMSASCTSPRRAGPRALHRTLSGSSHGKRRHSVSPSPPGHLRVPSLATARGGSTGRGGGNPAGSPSAHRPVTPIALAQGQCRDLRRRQRPVARASRDGEPEEETHERSRRIKGRFWLTQGFPLKPADLLPLMDVVEPVNRHFRKVAGFLRKNATKGLFPVKIQVPLMMTVYALLTFREFKLLKDLPPNERSEVDDPAFFTVPPSYLVHSMDEVIGQLEALEAQQMDEREREGDDDDEGDDEDDAEGSSQNGRKGGKAEEGTSGAAMPSELQGLLFGKAFANSSHKQAHKRDGSSGGGGGSNSRAAHASHRATPLSTEGSGSGCFSPPMSPRSSIQSPRTAKPRGSA